MREFCRRNREKLISGLLSGSLLTGDLIITILANTGLSEPVFPDTSTTGHIFLFPIVVFGISGFLGVILAIYRDVMKWLLNIHAAFLVLTLLISMTSFMAISNNVRTFDMESCYLNGTVCDCRDGTEMVVDCDTLYRLHVVIFIIIVMYLSCMLLCLVESVWDAKRMCCSDEIEDIPGVLDDDDDNDDEKTSENKISKNVFTLQDNLDVPTQQRKDKQQGTKTAHRVV
ncbi:uncharacterized protein LOC133180853 [Saccostrea echinata]|uniref:uncharacterized protein LOC133180853 n=1 Tax=Saccostrea echinata TaxID=191078 RepID=UPI002A83AC2E|nr:uncharacterized protein LOC133180853 [Saccostrea echinata]